MREAVKIVETLKKNGAKLISINGDFQIPLPANIGGLTGPSVHVSEDSLDEDFLEL